MAATKIDDENVTKCDICDVYFFTNDDAMDHYDGFGHKDRSETMMKNLDEAFDSAKQHGVRTVIADELETEIEVQTGADEQKTSEIDLNSLEDSGNVCQIDETEVPETNSETGIQNQDDLEDEDKIGTECKDQNSEIRTEERTINTSDTIVPKYTSYSEMKFDSAGEKDNAIHL